MGKRQLLTITILLSFAFVCSGFDAGGKKLELGLCAGLLGGGNIDAAWHDDFAPDETRSFTAAPSFMSRFVADYFMLPYLGVGICVNYAQVTPEHDIEFTDDGVHYVADKNDISIMDLCLGIKTRLQVNEFLAFKPGLYMGFRTSFSKCPAVREFGMALNASVETQLYVVESLYFFIDTGFLSQPYGGIPGIAYVRGGPMYYACMGVGF